MDKLLEIKNLAVDFLLDSQVIHAVSGVDLFVRPNETVVLAGESGSGKTITALSITGLLPANARIVSGEIDFQGQNILGLKQGALSAIRGSKIAYIFQEPASFLNPVQTIADQITETIIFHQHKSPEQARQEAAGLLADVRISDTQRVLDSYPHQLSGGMNQRVYLAMSLASHPQLLIADEPTTSLDVTIEAQILKLLMELKTKWSFSLLFITHNLAIARKIGQRVYVMYQGKIVEEADVQTLFKTQKHFHSKELIEAYQRIGKL